MSSVNVRHLRYRQFDRLRHGRKFKKFLSTQASRLSGTGAGTVVTFTNATNLLNLTLHTYTTGDGPFLLSNSGGVLPTGLDDTTFYWVRVNDANSVTLHTSEAGALDNSDLATFTTDGTGTHNILTGAESKDIFNALLAGKTSGRISALTTIDDL